MTSTFRNIWMIDLLGFRARLGLILAVFALIATVPSTAQAKNVLVIGPHPDDECLLGAARIRSSYVAGDSIKTVLVTNGDFGGTTIGHARQGESVAAAATLGLAEQDVIFLGYPDGSMLQIYNDPSGSAVHPSSTGQVATYGSRGLGGVDFHRYLFGVPAPYSRDAVLADVEELLLTFFPDEIYTVSNFDTHTDHVATALFVTDALVALKRQGVNLSTKLYQSIVWDGAPGPRWPAESGFTPQLPLPQPGSTAYNQLVWSRAQHFLVPSEMQAGNAASNLKYQALTRYTSQFFDWFATFVRRDEIFWVTDFGANLAITSQVLVSSENIELGSVAAGAVDGVLGDGSRQWASQGELGGAWIELSWSQPVTLSALNLYDRPETSENILGGTLLFSDGSRLAVGALPIDGKPATFTFPRKTVSWVTFSVEQAEGSSVGLSEFEALGVSAGSTVNVAPLFVREPSCVPSTITAAQSCILSASAIDLNGEDLQYLWTAEAGTIQADGSTTRFTPPSVANATAIAITAQAVDSRGLGTSSVAFVTVTPVPTDQLTLTSSTLSAGESVTAIVTLANPAPADGTLVNITSSAPAVVSVPASVSVPAGASVATFIVIASSVTTETAVTITASVSGSLRSVQLIVQPRLGDNLAPFASANASTEATSTQQTAAKAIDGFIDGSPYDFTREWATQHELNGAWLELSWPMPLLVQQVRLYDRPNTTDNIVAGTLLFSDGSSVNVGALPSDGSGLIVPLSERAITQLRFRVDQAMGANVGLAEIQVYGSWAGSGALAISPATLTGGSSTQATLLLSAAAPTGGSTVTLASDHAAATVPSSITVPAGANSATFTVNTSAVQASTTVLVSAIVNGTSLTAQLVIQAVPQQPQGDNLARAANASASSQNAATQQLAAKVIDGVVDGSPYDFTREWATISELNGAWIQLAWPSPVVVHHVGLCDRPNLADNILAGTLSFSDGSSLVIGALPGDGACLTLPIPERTISWIRLRVDQAVGSNIGLSEFEVLGSWSTTGIITLASTAVTAGESAQGMVVLPAPAPAGGTTVQLTSSNTAVASVPSSVTVPESATSVSFGIQTQAVSTATTVTIGGGVGGATFSTSLGVQPSLGFNLAPSAVATASSESGGTQQLATKAIDGSIDGFPGDYTREWASQQELVGAWIQLSWAIPLVARQVKIYDRPNLTDNILAGTLLLSDGSTIAVGALPSNGDAMTIDFPERTVSSIRFRVDQAAGSNIGLAEFQVIGVSSSSGLLTISPTTVGAGANAQVSLNLPAPAPIGGTTVSLATSNPSVVTVPSTVTVPSGSTTASFSVATLVVPATTSVTISATVNGVTLASQFTIQPSLGSNLASAATVTVSSQNGSTQQLGTKAIDGVIDGSPGDYTREWATQGELSGAWIQLTWPAPIIAREIRLYDRPNTTDNVLAGTVHFSDGSSVTTGALPANGVMHTVNFAERTVSWVRFHVDQAAGGNIGLAEMAVIGSWSASPIINLIPPIVDGGESVEASILLPNAAPSGGTTVVLSSSDPAVAMLPTTITVPAGVTSTTFVVDTSSVVATKMVTIGGIVDGSAPFAAALAVAPSLGMDLALWASVTASSQTEWSQQLAIKAVDGVVDGFPGDYTREWATQGEQAGAWIELAWANPVSIRQVTLHDRPIQDENILAGTLLFSDGTSVAVGQLPNNGAGLIVDIPQRTVSWVRFTVDRSVGYSIGLAEFAVVGTN